MNNDILTINFYFQFIISITILLRNLVFLLM